jgi:hypothetical protein
MAQASVVVGQDFLNKNPGAYRLDTKSDLFDLMQLDKMVEKAGEVRVVELSGEPTTFRKGPFSLLEVDLL